MTEEVFFNGISNSKENILQKLLNLLEENEINYCTIGGLAVNAYVEPVVSLDLDIVIAAEALEKFINIVKEKFELKEFSHSINLYSQASDLRIQIQTDERYRDFVGRAQRKEILGYEMRVASLADVLQGKIWAYSDTDRRKSKRQKDLADIFRIIETYPELKKILPENIQKMI